jgi:hypothetical protein
MSDETREVKLTGGALHKSRSRRSTRKNRQDGGDNSGALMQLANQSAPAMGVDLDAQKLTSEFRGQVGSVLASNFGPASSALGLQGPDKAQSGGKYQKGGSSTGATVNLASNRAPTDPGSPSPVPIVSGINPSQPAPVGGARLVLAPPKRKTRIHLKKRIYGGSDSLGKSNVPPLPMLEGGAKTKKARKIHLRVKGVTARLSKAKKAKKTAMSAPIGEVRARLEAAGVIKKGSKAPEAMMRTMYADLLITKKGL